MRLASSQPSKPIYSTPPLRLFCVAALIADRVNQKQAYLRQNNVWKV